MALVAVLFCSLVSAFVGAAAQNLDTPPLGADEGDEIEMHCHYHSDHTLDDILAVNWFHGSTNAEDLLYSHPKSSDEGSIKGEWEDTNRVVNGTFYNILYAITVQMATTNDEKKYICQYVDISFGYHEAESTLLINVLPISIHTDIQYTGAIIEGVIVDIHCVITEYKYPMKLEVKWKINDGTFIDSTNTSNDEVGELFKTTASLLQSFNRDDRTIHCIAIWDGTEIYSVSSELDVVYPPLKATPVQDEVVSEINKTTTLDCTVQTDDAGNPDTYIFTWTRKEDASFNARNNGTLILVPSSENYHDVYSCLPENIAGTGIRGEIYLIIEGSPVISSLAQPENSTSTVISLSFYLNSTGGSTSLTLSLWYQDIGANYSGSIHDIPISANNGDTIYVNVEELMPNTTYKLALQICDAEDTSLFSNNITETGTTTASPLLHFHSGKLEHDQLTVQWDYISVPGHVKVSVCMEYWTTSSGRDTSKHHPSTGLCDIPVENRIMSVLGDFVIDETYAVYLHVSENGFPGTASGQQQIDISNQSSGMTTGEIAAITVSVIFSVFLVVFIMLLFLGIVNIKPVYDCRENDRDTDISDLGQTNKTYETPAKTSEIDLNQNTDDQTYEQLKVSHSTAIRESQIELNIRQEDTEEIYMEPQMGSC